MKKIALTKIYSHHHNGNFSSSCPSYFILLLVVGVLFLNSYNGPVSGETYIVFDTDGSIEDYAALMTIGRMDTTIAKRLRIISVHNTGWSYASGASTMIQRFRLIADLPNAKVTVGALETMDERLDASSSTTPGLSFGASSCASSQGFPATPFDAAQRNMCISRSDVTAAFTMGDRELLSVLPSSGSHTAPSTTTYTELTNLVSSCNINEDKIVYLQMGTASTLAEITDEWENLYPNVLQTFLSITELHVLERGHAGGIDKDSMTLLLTKLAKEFTTYPVHMYMPSFFNSHLRFSAQEWTSFERSAASSSLASSWVFSAWDAKRRLYFNHGTVGEEEFYAKSYPGGTLVALCALQQNYHDILCPAYAGSSRELLLEVSQPPTLAKLSDSSTFFLQEEISGDNVTYPFSYVTSSYREPPGNVTKKNTESKTSNTSMGEQALNFRLYSSQIAAPETIPSKATFRNSLATSFWMTWHLCCRK